MAFQLFADPNAVHGGNAVHIVSVLSSTLAGSVVAARLLSRVWLKRRFGWDDWTILGAALCSFAFSGLVCTGWRNGLGKHTVTMAPKTIFKVLKHSWIASLFNKSSTTLSKLSIFLLLLHLLPTKSHRAFRILLITLLATTTTIGLASVLVTLFQCTPVEKAYNRGVRGTCVNTGRLWKVGGGILAGTDFLVLLSAVLVMVAARSRVSAWKTRVGVLAALALGCFVCTASVLRVTSLPPQKKLIPDPTWDSIYPTIYALLETNSLLICACLQPLALLFPRAFPVVPATAPAPADAAGDEEEGKPSQEKEEAGGMVG